MNFLVVNIVISNHIPISIIHKKLTEIIYELKSNIGTESISEYMGSEMTL